MTEPPERRPPDPEDEETRLLPPDDSWPEEETVVERRRRAAPPPEPVRRERVREERRDVPPPREPPPDRALWPWLLLLLALVLAGLAAVWYFTREDEPEPVPVPSVVRLPEADAVQRIEELGLRAEIEQGAASVPQGIVFAQSPEAGTTLEQGEIVTIQVSTGPDTATVPTLVGLPEAQARERLDEAGLEVTREGTFSDQPQGFVVAQAPEAGEEIELGGAVRITVSEGTGAVEVPDVVGLLVDEARAALAEQDLEANVVSVPSNEPEGTVVAQNPGGGAEATRGDAVRLNVSAGP